MLPQQPLCSRARSSLHAHGHKKHNKQPQQQQQQQQGECWCNSAPSMRAPSPEQFQPVGVWQSLRDDGKARSCSTGKVARNEMSVIRSQPPAAPLHWRGRRGSADGACAATDRPMSHWPRQRHGGRGGGERRTRTDTSNSNPDRFSGAPRHRQQTIFRAATPRAPCSRAPAQRPTECGFRPIQGRAGKAGGRAAATRAGPDRAAGYDHVEYDANREGGVQGSAPL
ncbi:unnamed protein product [Pleuronectes platessa]|uniref:Uncharacterized protein n=1 Tax=Pleuronectes platessa TaxID=8262 RepID=A0A9N7UAF7_PLEPL|nr:unnamed protein product [Pleuronectes platessa]